jgi:hypothetical protein
MKAELLKKLSDNGVLGTFKEHPVWVEAFDAYKNSTGDTQVGYKCGSCYRKVLAWLRK